MPSNAGGIVEDLLLKALCLLKVKCRREDLVIQPFHHILKNPKNALMSIKGMFFKGG